MLATIALTGCAPFDMSVLPVTLSKSPSAQQPWQNSAQQAQRSRMLEFQASVDALEERLGMLVKHSSSPQQKAQVLSAFEKTTTGAAPKSLTVLDELTSIENEGRCIEVSLTKEIREFAPAAEASGSRPMAEALSRLRSLRARVGVLLEQAQAVRNTAMTASVKK
ncbi:MAG: hypothetical protein ACOYMN_01560 [Roseimicrobium sp.]